MALPGDLPMTLPLPVLLGGQLYEYEHLEDNYPTCSLLGGRSIIECRQEDNYPTCSLPGGRSVIECRPEDHVSVQTAQLFQCRPMHWATIFFLLMTVNVVSPLTPLNPLTFRRGQSTRPPPSRAAVTSSLAPRGVRGVRGERRCHFPRRETRIFS